MPTVLRWRGYRFYFFSNEGDEPPHIHVDRDGNTVKFWLSDVEVACNFGFAARDLAIIADKVRDEREHFIEAWHEYFGRKA
jgi:hypothetical protein